jgi:hypothetical protein
MTQNEWQVSKAQTDLERRFDSTYTTHLPVGSRFMFDIKNNETIDTKYPSSVLHTRESIFHFVTYLTQH